MSVNFNNSSLKKWNEIHPNPSEDEKLKDIFKKGMISVSDCAKQFRDKFLCTPDPYIHSKAILLGVIEAFDRSGHSCRTLLQNQRQTKCITLDILDEAFEAPSLEISRVIDVRKEKQNDSIGPIIPVRYSFANVENSKNEDKIALGEIFKNSIYDNSFANKSFFDGNKHSFEVEDKELEIILNWLESATKNIAAECLDQFQRSQLHHNGNFKLSYLHIIETLHSIDVAKVTALSSDCSNPDCKNAKITSIKLCSVCRTPYCSKDCQKADW